MCLDLLLAISRLLAKVQELLTLLNGSIQLSLSLVNHADLLVALGLDVAILGVFGHCQTLLEELERHVKLLLVQVLVCNHLVDAN